MSGFALYCHSRCHHHLCMQRAHVPYCLYCCTHNTALLQGMDVLLAVNSQYGQEPDQNAIYTQVQSPHNHRTPHVLR